MKLSRIFVLLVYLSSAQAQESASQRAEALFGQLLTTNDDQIMVELANMRLETVVPMLVEKILHNQDFKSTWYAARILGMIGPPAAAAGGGVVPALARVLVLALPIPVITPENFPAMQWEDARICGILQALEKMGPDAASAVPAIVQVLASSRSSGGFEDVSVAAIVALGRIGPNAASAVPTMVEALLSIHPYYRREIVKALGCIGPGAVNALPALVQSLGDYDDEIIEAINLIDPGAGSLDPGTTIPALIRIIGSPDKNIVPLMLPLTWAAKDILRKLRFPAGYLITPEYTQLLTSWDPETTSLALEKLGSVETPGLAPILSVLLRKQLTGHSTDKALVESLVEKAVSCPEAAPYLIEMVLDKPKVVYFGEEGENQTQKVNQKAARAYLVKLGDQAVPALLAALPKNKCLVLDILCDMGPCAYPAREVLLAEMRGTEDLCAKTQILYILGEIGNPGDLAFFVEASNDVEWSIRAAAVEALGKAIAVDEEERTAIVAALTDGLSDSDPAVSKAARRALKEFSK